MEIIVHFESSVARRAVALHAWEPQGEVWDITARAPDGGDTSFQFRLVGAAADQRTLQFKFRFPEEKRWEADDLIRRISTRRVQSFWTFDHSPRVMIRDPARGVVPDRIAVHLLTRSRFAGGRLYAWRAGGDRALEVAESERDPITGVSVFEVQLQEWMRQGFHFKFVDARGRFENERSNRVWRPADGADVYVKTGQVSLRTEPLTLREAEITLLLPRAMTAPAMRVRDDVEEYETVVSADAPSPLDEDRRFLAARYRVSVFPQTPYVVSVGDASALGAPIVRPLRIAEEDTGAKLKMLALYGDDRWLKAVPPVVPVQLAFHSRSWSPPVDDLAFELGIGDAPAFERVAARLGPDNTWRAATTAFSGVSLYATPVSAAPIDQRPDGAVTSRRRRFTLADVNPVLHTVDGQIGFSPNPPPLPAPADPPVTRTALMAAAFGSTLTGAGIFDPLELPHGATRLGGEVYFVVSAPHAVRMELVLLDAADTRVSQTMEVTTDNRYWWCRLPATQVPEGQRYRFLQNTNVEVLDPATRWASDPARELWANVGEKGDRAWSLYLDHAALRKTIAPGFNVSFEDLIIYELHPLRFTVRNRGAADGLDQVAAELAPGRYLQRLGVTALAFLPLHEFSKGSWGYNPSLFFAIDSDVGGPTALARAVQAAHAAGKGVMMDLVFNHVVESPLQALAKDVYVDGDTAWGDEINYDSPLVREFFRQAVLYLWNTFSIDGFRFDSTEAIVNGQWPKAGVINVGGSGGGWDFLGGLRWAVRRAADAVGRRWPFMVGENDPNNWGMTDNRNGGVLDGQWHFGLHYPLDHASCEDGDDSGAICSNLAVPHVWLRPFSEAVRYAESHDSCGRREDWKVRLVRRAPFGRGFQTAKAAGTVALLAHGVPMLFQGQEGGEDEDFFFDYDPAFNRTDPRYFARLDLYEDLGDDRNRIFAWYRDLMGLRNDGKNGLRGNDNQITGRGYRTVAFSRAGGCFFVVATFGTPDTRQDLGWLGLPAGASYKEIFNSSWPAYRVENEDNFTNGSYGAVLTSSSVVNLPPVGGVVLERL